MRQGAATVLVVAAALGISAPVSAAPGNWDHEKNIKDAAERLVKLHRRKGSKGVLTFLEACYRTHTIASDYTKGLEACLAQDYIHTRVLAAIYAKLPPGKLKSLGAPTAPEIAQSLNTRVAQTFMQYKVTVADADDFKRIVDKVGVPIFLKGVFPHVKELDAPQLKTPAGK